MALLDLGGFAGGRLDPLLGGAFPVAAWTAALRALRLAVEDWSNNGFRSMTHTEKRAFAPASERSACADIRESRADSPRMRSQPR